jgi:hypothetical protein
MFSGGWGVHRLDQRCDGSIPAGGIGGFVLGAVAAALLNAVLSRDRLVQLLPRLRDGALRRPRSLAEIRHTPLMSCCRALSAGAS